MVPMAPCQIEAERKRHRVGYPNSYCSMLASRFSKSMCICPSGTKDFVRICQLRRNSFEGLISIAVSPPPFQRN